MVLGLALLSATACGDPLLPADYQGPPAVAVGGSVVRAENVAYTEARDPRFSIEWLSALQGEPSALLSQAVTFARSQHLRKDWDIGLDLPKNAAKINVRLGAASANVAIGKLVYFDDKNGDRRLDWNCDESHCDQVKALGVEFVVYLDQPLSCPSKTVGGPEKKTRLTSGFHYFVLEGTTLIETAQDADLRFDLTDTPAAQANPTAALLRFLQQFQRLYGLGPLTGC